MTDSMEPQGNAEAPAAVEHRVLVVDDDDSVRVLLGGVLRSHGYIVDTARCGQVALDMMRRTSYEVVVSDMSMPGMDGLTLIAQARMIDPSIQVIVVSSAGSFETVVAAMKRGASDYLLKSGNTTSALLIAVERALERRELKRGHDALFEALQNRNLELEQKNQENARLVLALRDFNEKLTERVRAATQELRETNEALAGHVTTMQALHDVSTALTSEVDPARLLPQIMDSAKVVMKAEASTLMLLDQETRELVFEVVQGDKKEALQKVRIPLGHGIAGWVASTGEALLVPDAYQDSRFDPEYDRRSGFRTRSILCTPLKTGDEIKGVVQVINRKDGGSFSGEDLRTFLSFANHASVALKNAQLYHELRCMAEDLRQALERERWLSIEKEKLGKFVSRNVVDEIHRSREQVLALGGRSVDATVLFADIAGFTRKCENAPPQTIVRLLNTYMTTMCGIIEEQEGFVDKFIGDGIMAVFIEGTEVDPHALRAVRAGVQMQAAVGGISTEWDAAGLGPLQVRIGINSGEVVSGSIGSETRMDMTVIGDNVNVASRVESHGVVGSVLVTQETYARVKDHFQAVETKSLQVKNRAQSVQTYSLRLFEPGK